MVETVSITPRGSDWDKHDRAWAALLSLAVGLCANMQASAGETIYPYVPTADEVARNYLVEHYIMVGSPQKASDDKTATVSATLPRGDLMRCTVSLARHETEPSKFDAAHWGVTGVSCSTDAARQENGAD